MIELRWIDQNGVEIYPAAPAPELPSDLEPGEFVFMPMGANLQWFVFLNKTRVWDGHRWKVSGTLSAFDPGAFQEKELYAYRRKMLKWAGHL